MCLLDVVKEDLKKRIEKESIKIDNIKDIIQNYQDRVNSQALQQVEIIAMTTTGAAKYKKLLQKIKSDIMIVEEAAEIVEAHITTSMTPSIKQLILIGDHQQLRPATNVMELSTKYNLDISMFERLINNGF